jgi:hypothetical protein
MIRWLAQQGGNSSKYIVEPFALDTLGNLVFSTRLLLIRGLQHPVFVSQTHNLLRLKLAAKQWLGQSGISPHYWMVADFQSKRNIETLNSDAADYLNDDIAGLGHPLNFNAGTISLPSHNWNDEKTKLAFDIAIRWLFRHSRNKRSGKLYYPECYGENGEEELLNDLGIRPDQQKRSRPLRDAWSYLSYLVSRSKKDS